MTITEFNNLSVAEMQEQLFRCCGSTNWSKQMSAMKPFDSVSSLKNLSDKIWRECNEEDYLEAFTHHPKIGDVKSLTEKFSTTKQWASGEQSGVQSASTEILEKLAEGNSDYERKFGYIFIVCATGKSANEMLELLTRRLPNSPELELIVAAQEQNKITHIRLDKLFS